MAAGVFILSAGLTIYVLSFFSSLPLQTTSYQLQTVSYVHDGDTVYLAPHHQSVRLIGIDAPELAGSYRCGENAKCDAVTEECGASEAKNKLQELVLNHKVVLKEDKITGTTDKYGRWLRYVFLCPPSSTSSCLDLSLELIKSGLVREAGFGNLYEKQKIYQEAELVAKRRNLGIWGRCKWISAIISFFPDLNRRHQL